MTPEQAADLAARTLAAIDANADIAGLGDESHAVDRERVASDLDGLRDAYAHDSAHNDHARRYADGLRRTAALYGVTA